MIKTNFKPIKFNNQKDITDRLMNDVTIHKMLQVLPYFAERQTKWIIEYRVASLLKMRNFEWLSEVLSSTNIFCAFTSANLLYSQHY